MKSSPLPTSRSDAPESQEPRTGRRQLVVGAGVAAGAALAVATFARHGAAPASAAKVESAPAQGEGYRLTDHVRRYYETART
jgi:class 3 adenylate cyclase